MSRFPLTTLRLYGGMYNSPEKRARICRMLDQYKGIDEVWLSTLAGTASLAKHKKNLEHCVEMAKLLRERNIAVSIQLASTIGHFSGYRFKEKDSFPWTQDDLLVGHDGSTAPGAFCCPNSPAFSDWCASVFAMYCKELQPLTAYVDDDLRMHNHGNVKQACCCKRCLERFSKATGRKWTRAQVQKMLDSRTPQPAKRQWIQQNTDITREFYEKVAKAVHAVSPNSHVGVQNQHAKIFYTTWNFAPIFDAIKKVTGLPARVRIGGGCWNEFEPSQLIRKSFITGCDIDDAKQCGSVDLMGHEEENWPCTIMSKSAHAKMLESAMHLAVGGNSLTFQSGDLWNDNDSTISELLGKIQMWYPLFTHLRELGTKYRFDGVTALVQDGIMEYDAHGEFPWYMFWAQESEYLRLCGVPVRLSKVASQQGSKPGFLTWETARGISKEDFEKFLRAGIVLTGNAYMELQKRGLTKDFKVKGKVFKGSQRAIFLKGDYAGTHWYWGADTPIGFTFEEGCKAEALMNYFKGEKVVAAWRLETPKGRIAVVGAPGDFTRYLSRLAVDLYRDLFDWVGAESISCRVENSAIVVVTPLADENGKIRAVTIMNSGTAPIEALRLQIRRPYSGKAKLLRAGEETVSLTAETVGKEGCKFVLPKLNSFEFALLELE